MAHLRLKEINANDLNIKSVSSPSHFLLSASKASEAQLACECPLLWTVQQKEKF